MNNETPPLPPIVTASQLVAANPAPPADIVPGLFHRQGKLALGGGSKTHKTWILADLALSVAAGVPWLTLPTVQGRVLYINFEIHDGFFSRRLLAICEAKGIVMPEALDLWNLRGHAAGYETLIPRIYEMVKDTPYLFIITDPMYKLYGNTDENSASDVARLFNGMEELTVYTGAGIAFGAHFSKGNQAMKEAIDRISGSGVFSRDPDTILNMTPHQEAGCFTMDITMRNYPPRASFVIRWEMPLMQVEPTFDPTLLRKTGGRPVKFSPTDLLDILRGMGPFDTGADFYKVVHGELGISKTRFYVLLATLKQNEYVIREGERWAYKH